MQYPAGDEIHCQELTIIRYTFIEMTMHKFHHDCLADFHLWTHGWFIWYSSPTTRISSRQTIIVLSWIGWSSSKTPYGMINFKQIIIASLGRSYDYDSDRGYRELWSLSSSAAKSRREARTGLWSCPSTSGSSEIWRSPVDTSSILRCNWYWIYVEGDVSQINASCQKSQTQNCSSPLSLPP